MGGIIHTAKRAVEKLENMSDTATTEQMRRIYMILRWYDRYVDSQQEVSEEDKKLAMKLELEMLELQRKCFEKEVKRKKRNGKHTQNKTCNS